MPLTELRQNLEAQIREGQLPEALNALLAELPDGSETYRIVSALIARLNTAKKERSKFTISVEEYMRLESQVSADLFDMLARLTEDDFSTASAKATEVGADKKGKYGTVLYRVPDVMTVQETIDCLIRVAVEEALIRKDLDIDEHVEIRTQVEISDVMRAEIVDPQGETFKIISHSAANQLVRATAITEWKFSVMPLRVGIHKLLVKVSIMEIVPGFPEPILRDVSMMETVTVVAQTSEAIGKGGTPIRSEDVDFKPNGQSFAFHSNSTIQGAYVINTQPAVEPPYSPGPANQPTNRPLRALALFLAFLVIIPTATWAIAPSLPAYVDARIQDAPEAYVNFIEKYPKSLWLKKAFYYWAMTQGTLKDYVDFIEKYPDRPGPEKVYFYRAEVSGQLADLRAYQNRFGVSGKYLAKVLDKISALETKSLDNIREQPDSLKIRKFVTEFPESERLAEVKQAVETRAVKRRELLAQVEDAYVSSLKARPTETKVTAYLRDFPKQEKLDEVDAAARAKPEVFIKVQSQLEDAYLKKMEQNPTKAQSEQFLEKFPEPVRREKFEKVLEQKPGLKKEAVEKMKQLRDKQSGAVESKLPESSELSGSSVAFEKRNLRSGFEMVFVSGGTYTMGDDTDNNKDNCAHQVTIGSFSIGKYEVTQADWRAVMGGDPRDLAFKGCDECPVERVLWNDIRVFLKLLNNKYPGKNFRLPSESEWEYAAIGGNKSQGYKYSGGNDLNKVGWHSGNSGSKTHRVGELTANELGLFDMSGNVLEWCWDYYGPYPGCSMPPSITSSRVLRGGGWNNNYDDCAVLRRNYDSPRDWYDLCGLRLAQGK